MIKSSKFFVLTVVIMSLSTVAFAVGETTNGTLTVTGTIDGTLKLTLETATNGGGNNLTLGGVTSATKALGTISKTMTQPADWALSTTVSDWTLATYVGVKVDKANLTSANHTLAARLSGAPTAGIGWSFGGTSLSTTNANVTATGAYDTKSDYLLSINVADTVGDGVTIDNTITLTATAN
jgi:hypothetical protein